MAVGGTLANQEEFMAGMSESAIDVLERQAGTTWRHIRNAREVTDKEHSFLSSKLSEFTISDSSIAVVGSLAREEFIPGSDID